MFVSSLLYFTSFLHANFFSSVLQFPSNSQHLKEHPKMATDNEGSSDNAMVLIKLWVLFSTDHVEIVMNSFHFPMLCTYLFQIFLEIQ